MADSIVERAKADFKLSVGVYGAQKKREIEDLAFCVTGNQWDETALRDREAWSDGNNKFPARPHPEIDKIAQPMRIVVNQWRQAHLGLNIHPDSEQADKDVAEIIQGRYRKDERDSGAVLARYCAYDRAVKAGLGWYFMGYEYDQTSEHAFDQRICWSKVPYQSDVYPDPSATEMDWSDGEFMLWPVWMPRDKFAREFGDSALARRIGAGAADWWGDLVNSEPAWVRGKSNDGQKDAVRVAKYWVKTYTDREASLLDDWSVVYSDVDGSVPNGRKVVSTRRVRDQKLTYYCLTGVEDKPLTTAPWNGKWFPLVPVIGEEKQPYDDQRRWEGMVRAAKDPQRTYNWAFANAMEEEALKSKAPRLLDPRQIAPYRAWWDQANIRPFPFLPYDASITNAAGQPLPPPIIDQADMSKMQGTFMLLGHAGEAIQDVTSLFDASLGRRNSADRSGKAILAQQGQGDQATSGFMQNFLDITLKCEGRIYLDLFPTIYERPGRLLNIMDGENEKTRRVMVALPYKVVDGMPQRARAGEDGVKQHDFRKGIYSLEAEAGRSWTSRVQQGQEQWPQMIQALGPEAGLVLAPTLLDFSDIPGSAEAADLMRKLRDSKMPFLVDQEAEATPDQLKAKLAAAGQQMQQMQQQLQQAGMAIQTDQAKQQAMIQKAQLDAEVKAQQAHMDALAAQADNQTKLEIAKLDAQTKISIAELQVGQQDAARKLEFIVGLLTRQAELAHEKRMDDEQGAHEVGLAAMDAADAAAQRRHEAGMAAADAAHAAAMPQADGSGE